MARNFMETEQPKEVHMANEAVENRLLPRQGQFEALGIPEPKVNVEPDTYRVLFDPRYALQPENYPQGGIQGFYNTCFDRLKYQQKELPNASARTILDWMHNNTVLGACTEYRCGKVVQRHIADQNMRKDGYLEV